MKLRLAVNPEGSSTPGYQPHEGPSFTSTSGLELEQTIYPAGGSDEILTIPFRTFELNDGGYLIGYQNTIRGYPLMYLSENTDWKLFGDNHDSYEYTVVDYKLDIYYYQNPLDPDTDGDGLPDLYEVSGWDSTVDGVQEHFYGDVFDETDRDNDGLGDLEEWRMEQTQIMMIPTATVGRTGRRTKKRY